MYPDVSIPKDSYQPALTCKRCVSDQRLVYSVEIPHPSYLTRPIAALAVIVKLYLIITTEQSALITELDFIYKHSLNNKSYV